MGIINSLLSYIGLKDSELKRVYCQNCGNDLTAKGGTITSTGKIYCNDPKNKALNMYQGCVVTAMLKEIELPENIIINNYRSPKEVQEAIKKKELVKFGLLEKKAVD